MADQTVRIEDSSRERVALDLVHLIRREDVNQSNSEDAILTLYSKCRSAVYGGNWK